MFLFLNLVTIDYHLVAKYVGLIYDVFGRSGVRNLVARVRPLAVMKG